MDNFEFDTEYLVRLRDRDPGTLAHFCEFFHLPIRNHIRHKFPYDSGDDLVQDVFVAALKRIDAGEPQDPTKLPGYVFGISNRLILQGYRAIRKDEPVDVDPSLLPDVKDRADVQVIKALDQLMVRRLVLKLSSRDRDVINRLFFLQQDRATAARELGVSQVNLRLLLCRALKRFRCEWNNIQ